MKKVAILILFMLGCAISEGYAQKVALKSNLLYDATTTMNLGLEIGLVRKWTLDIPVNYNPWKLSDGKRLRHWGIQPEVRYWFCESFRRMFIGMYNPQIQISAESETKRSIFREKDKTKRSKKESAQHSKSRNKSFVMTSVSAL